MHPPVASTPDQAGTLQHPQMLRHRRQRHRMRSGQIRHASIAAREVLQDASARRISQGRKGAVKSFRRIFNHLVKHLTAIFWLRKQKILETDPPANLSGPRIGHGAFGPLVRTRELREPPVGRSSRSRRYTTAVSVSSITSGCMGFPNRTARSTPATTNKMPSTVCAV